MTVRLPQIQERIPVVDPQTGRPSREFVRALNDVFKAIEVAFNNQDAQLVAIQQAQAAAATAQAAAATAQTAAATAQTAATDVATRADVIEQRLDDANIP